MRYFLTLPILAVLLISAAQTGFAQAVTAADIDLNDDDIYQASLKALTVLLVVAILIENALALVFNWKVFRTYFSERGLKTIVSFVVAFVVVRQFEVDIMASLLTAYGDANVPEDSTLATEVLTALIVAGGSAGVHNVMRALGYRGETESSEELPPTDRAWIAIRVTRKSGRGALQVAITEDPTAPATLPAMAGTVMAAKPSLWSLLTRNTNRFPQNGGYEVTPGKAYRISVMGPDGRGGWKVVDVNSEPVRFAERALVDFDITF